MKQLTPFPNEDLKMIRWRMVFFVLCCALAAGMFWGAEALNSAATRNLNIAQSGLYGARSDVEQIAEEEATIIEYIDRYQELSNQGIVDAEDRLLFLEKVAELRSEFNLFPIALNVGGQMGMRLQYDPSEPEPGGPIDLKTSTISINLPLLHEGDLTRFLDGLLNSDGLYQARECEIVSQNQSAQRYYLFLGQHLSANCEIIWHTFELPPPA